MKKIINSVSLVSTFVLLSLWVGCSDNAEPLAPASSQEIPMLSKQTGGSSVDVVPVFRIPTGHNSERLTVFVFYGKGGNGGGKPPKDDGSSEKCSDTNTNVAFSEIGVHWTQPQLMVEYQPTFEPEAVAGMAFDAIDRAFSTWETAVTNADLMSFSENITAPLPPDRDGQNIVGWRQLVGRNARKVLAATYIWDDGNGTILEADIVYNTSHNWAINTVIGVGTTECGTDFDVQAIGTHEIGHFIGLNHVSSEDATMAPTAAKGELKKQTLTPGDVMGANVVVPSIPAS